jgi:hypothetical protein
VAVYFLHRAYKAGTKIANIEESPQILDLLEKLAKYGINAIEEQVHKALKGLVADAPQTPEEKKAAAIQVMRSMAPKADFSDEQAGIAIEAVLNEKRSMAPPPFVPEQAAGLAGTVYKSINPGAMP